ncbi:MAG: metalloregulator ArsR/SmtB family transcription factor [Candidatus Omnitrophica bacterium]|nr:metalloregulator ArsR/SmtB family transcription factor [Candidatus Omnitrophota bacterium]
MKQYINLFKALSDETRLRIAVLLSEKELCVCQIQSALSLSQTKISRHLTVLRYIGIVKNRREGLWVYYSLSKPKNKLEENLFECFRRCLRKDNVFKTDLSRMQKCIVQPLGLVSKIARKL